MQPRQVAFLDELHRVFKHRLGFRRETGDDVSAKGHVRPQSAGLLGKADRIIAQVAAFHALQNHIVAMLQRQVQMRHQARFGGDGLHQVFVHFDRVDRGNPQARQIGHQPQDAHHQIA